MREVIESTRFKKDLKRVSKSGRYDLDDFMEVIKLLLKDEALPQKYRDHNLEGEWDSFRECHIKPDWLLIYKKDKKILYLVRTGSHSELF